MTDQTPKSQGSSSIDDLKTLRKQWFTDPLAERPQAGEIYRHRKHDADAGKWHEYEVLHIISTPSSNPHPTTNFPLGSCTHTETGVRHALIECRNKVYASPQVFVPHVAYRNTQDPGGEIWLRPLGVFMDGRFQLTT